MMFLRTASRSAIPLTGMLIAAVLVVTRRPDAVFHAQFYGEDGATYYANMYSHGLWDSVVTPQAGYLQLVPVLAAWVAQVVPVHLAPLVMNATAIGFMVLPVGLLLSDRARAISTRLRVRVLLALLVVAMPGVAEIHASIVNAQWYLAPAAAIVLLIDPPSGRAGRVLDAVILTLCSLTGVYCLVLFPLAAMMKRLGRRAVPRLALVVLGAGALIQLVYLTYLTHHPISELRPAPRFAPPLDPSPLALFRITVGRILLPPFLGEEKALTIAEHEVLLVILISVGLTSAVVAFRRGTPELRFMVLSAGGMLGLELARPLNPWPVLSREVLIDRYWFSPKLAVVCLLVWALGQPKARHVAGIGLACVALIGVPHDWEHPAFASTGWTARAKAFEKAPRGTRAVLPQYPVGYAVRLTKR